MKIRILIGLVAANALAHDHPGHSAPTYEISASTEPSADSNAISLSIVDHKTGEPLAAKFSIEIDGNPFTPSSLSKEGIRFTSIHTAKKQRETILYTRGEGAVRFAALADSKVVTLHVTRGYEYLPVTKTVAAGKVEVRLKRWIDLGADGWHASDPHLHYERVSPDRDSDWAKMLEADGLSQGFFMILKGGNFPGIWAEQFAYGTEGTRAVGQQLLVPGEEFRGSAQGHNNLFRMAKVIEPISVGGMGTPAHRPNWPSMHDVLKETTESGGIGGPAHGGTFGKASTVYVDAILGASEFVEIANSHLYELEPWYRLLNCGVILPPVAGTDLPNFPYRETWQPFFGEIRTYVRADDPTSFDAWKEGARDGRTMVTSGPLIQLQVRKSGNDVTVSAELTSPLPLSKLEIIRNGEPIEIEISKSVDERGVNRWLAEATMSLTSSCWFAARGEGPRKRTLWAKSGILKPAIAHTAAVPMYVDDQPIRVPASVDAVKAALLEQQAWYREKGVFPNEASREKMLDLFDQAIARLSARIHASARGSVGTDR